MSLCVLRQVTRLELGLGRPSSLHDLPLAPSADEAPAPPPPTVVLVREVTSVVGVDVLAISASTVTASSSIVATPLLSAGVATNSAHVMLPPHSSSSPVPPSIVLSAASSSSSSRPHVSLDHLYTCNDVDSLWGANYKQEQKTHLALCQPLIETLFGQLGSKTLWTPPKSFFREVWRFWRRMDNGTKRLYARCRPWRWRLPNEGLLLARFGDKSALR